MTQSTRLAAKAKTTWLLITHGLPTKPAYLRVKIGRLLRATGAVAIKNTVHALPLTPSSKIACEDLAAEIAVAGGEVMVCEAKLVAGIDDAGLRSLFDAARDADYQALAKEGRALLTARVINENEVQRLRRRRDEVAELDFFAAHSRQSADDVLAELDRKLRQHPDVSRQEEAPKQRLADLRNRMWVTRKHIHVDRIASAWLIRRFIDKGAVFKFVEGKNYKPKARELRFDMPDAEFTHEGKNCTFETLVLRCNLGSDRAIKAIAEIIHDLDVDGEKYGRPETPGLMALISGICAKTREDKERLRLGAEGLDQFYAYFNGL